MYSGSNTRVKKNRIGRQCHYFWRICIGISLIIVVLIFFIMNFIVSVILPEKSIISEVATSHTLQTEIISNNSQNSSTHYIYIDIGCFNGETIEHFLHFTPNSSVYDIITFEPDPYNYQLCKQRLTQKKYADINITILQKVVWIRDEKVFFQTNRGRYSRIITNKTAAKNHSTQIDAIDFSSWLVRLAKQKQTQIHIKMSTPGAEVAVLEKMILDETLELADKYEVEWSDRDNPHNTATRIYLQLMFDNYGFNNLYYTRLQDARNIFKINGTFTDVQKYYNWQKINSSDAYAHYHQRSEVIKPLHKLKHMKR